MTEKIITKKVLKWYDLNKRNLPWRKKVPSYKKHYYTLVSEFMLQQTQVNTVIPFFNAFYKKYKNIQSLSKTSNTRILKSWQGLGFYRRAKNIFKTKEIIKNEFRNRFPKKFEELILLPGIGRSTAGAIMSIAYNKSYPILDANVKRVISRYENIDIEQKNAIG